MSPTELKTITSAEAKPLEESTQNPYVKPPGPFTEALDDAERFLKFAAEAGIDVDPAVRKSVLEARSAYATAWDESVSANLLQSLTKLAAQLKPVTAESLNACAQDSSRTVRAYWTVAIVLAIFIVPFSLASFVTSAISDKPKLRKLGSQ